MFVSARCYPVLLLAVHAAPPAGSSRGIDFGSLKQFVLDHQGVVAVDLVESLHAGKGGGRGLVAAKALQPGDSAVTVPECLMMTSKSAGAEVQELSKLILRQYSEEGNIDETTTGDLTNAMALGTFLLQEMKKKGSVHSEYFKSLPKELPLNYPLWPGVWQRTYDRFDLQGNTLSFDKVLTDLLLRMGKLKDPRNPFTSSEVQVAVALMRSRKFDGRMIPLLDLANHAFAPDKNCKVLCTNASCSLEATRPVAAGEEVLYEYSDVGNLRMLATFGFHLETNPYSSTSVNFPPAPPALADKFGCIQDNVNARHSFTLNATGEALLKPEAMQCLQASFQGRESQALEHLRDTCLHARKNLAGAWETAKDLRAMADKGKLHEIGVHILDELMSEMKFVTSCLVKLEAEGLEL